MYRNVQMLVSLMSNTIAVCINSLQTLPIHWAYISAATVMCMSAVYTQYIGNIDNRKHLDMFSTDKENFQPKVGWIHGAEVGKGRNVYTADYRTWSPPLVRSLGDIPSTFRFLILSVLYTFTEFEKQRKIKMEDYIYKFDSISKLFCIYFLIW